MGKFRIVDLSAPLENIGAMKSEEIKYVGHEEAVEIFAKPRGVAAKDLPNGKYCAVEKVSITTHSKTHMDAPWHYGPESEGKAAKTIDEIPLEWCYGDGVILDLTYKNKGEVITVEDLQKVLKKVGYVIKPYDIVFIRTDASKHIGEEGYENMHPGMSREATLWLIEQGVKVMGIDAWGWDRPFDEMEDEYRRGIKNKFWAAHFVGREKEYCHIENLVNLDQIPKPYGFKVAVFPIKIKRASAGWVRAVTIIEE
jgi:kynurenine formamidase